MATINKWGVVLPGLLFLVIAGDGPLHLPKPLPQAKHPDGNPATPAKIALGRKLFFDPRLSRNGKMSCATCHDPEKGFSNGEQFAAGVNGKRGTRNVPTLYNVAHGRDFFWDGRAATLEKQALAPIQNPIEMDMSLRDLVKKLNAIPAYRESFPKVLGGPPTANRIAKAIAAYERTIISNDTPFDHYLRGDKKALSPAALRGMRLFYGQARCFVCHKGPNLSDNEFHNIGVFEKNGQLDLGRRKVTGKKTDHGRFKTPTLREVARTAPYMHNGSFETLKQVVQHYNFGGVTDEPNDYRDDQLQVLYLGEDQVDDLVTFLTEGLSTKDLDKKNRNDRNPR